MCSSDLTQGFTPYNSNNLLLRGMKIMISRKTVNTLLASAVALTVGAAANTADAKSGDKEKCYGVVKAGHNDCGNAGKTHSCAGQASVDGAGDEWVSLPTGTCDKLAGGSLTPVKDEDMTDAHGHKKH